MGVCLSNERKVTPVVERKGTPVVLKMKLDCLRCESEVKKALKGFPGVEAVDTDFKNNKVTVWGDVDPCNIMKRIKKKTGKVVEIDSPAKPPEKHVRIKEKTEKVVEIGSPANSPKKHVRIKKKREKVVEIGSPANPLKKRQENEEKGGKGGEGEKKKERKIFKENEEKREKERNGGEGEKKEGGGGRKDVNAPVVKKAIKEGERVKIKNYAKTGKEVDLGSPANSPKKTEHSNVIIINGPVIIQVGADLSKDNDTERPKEPVAAMVAAAAAVEGAPLAAVVVAGLAAAFS